MQIIVKDFLAKYITSAFEQKEKEYAGFTACKEACSQPKMICSVNKRVESGDYPSAFCD